MIKLATVSPCFNEEEGLAQSVAKLTDLFQALIAEGKIAPDSMIVLVNDGSRDKTWDIISQLHRDNPLVRGINLSHNAGHQNAIMAGMMTAKNWADAVITLDADLQDNYRKHSYDPKYLYCMRAFKTIQDYFDIKQKLYWTTKNTEDRKKILEEMKTKIR